MSNIKAFLSRIENGKRVSFAESMRIIDEYYTFRPVQFTNGPRPDQVANQAGTNEGSCKILAFDKLQGLKETEALALFGDYYWRDVLEHPDGDNHANIRTFLQYGWAHIRFFGEALSPRHCPPDR